MPNLHVAHEVHRWGTNGEATAMSQASAREDNKDNLKGSSGKVRSADNLLHPAEKKTTVTLSNGGAMFKSKSYSNLQSHRLNDRVIDGPLPSLSQLKSTLLRARKTHKEKRESSSSEGSPHPPPLCFSIAGGLPRGRVSWMVLSVPAEDGEEEHRRGPEDWRAIN